MRASFFDGVRVVALEQAVAGPLCARHLADLGADVVKLERPGTGDLARWYDESVLGYSSHFVWLNRGKRSVALDVKSSDGRQVFDRLLAGADVFLANLSVAAIERLVDDDELGEQHPRLIRCYISGYGASGSASSRKSFDALVQGEAGITLATGTDGEPAKPGVSIADVGAGAYAFGVIAAALLDRERTGRGRRLDISLFDVAAEWLSPLLLVERNGGQAPAPAGTHHASIAPYGAYRTTEGRWVNLAIQTHAQWERFCRVVLDQPELADDERFETNQLRIEHRPALEELVAATLARMSEIELFDRLERADIPAGALNPLDVVVKHPALVERDKWQAAELPDGTFADVLADPFVIDGQGADGIAAVPELGQHTASVLAELGYDADFIARIRGDGGRDRL